MSAELLEKAILENAHGSLGLSPLGSIGQFGGQYPQDRKVAANDPFSPVTES
jgi:hypothetical protein